MIGYGLLQDAQRLFVERLGLGVLALIVVERRQVVEAGGHTRMLRPQGRLLNRQRPFVEGLGLGVLALATVELSQVVEALGNM